MDQDLVTRAQQGDQRAFEALTVADQPRLFKFAYGILRDRHLAEDAMQQSFLDIWRHLPRLRDAAKHEVWSYRLIVHACYAEAMRKPMTVTDDEGRVGHQTPIGSFGLRAEGPTPSARFMDSHASLGLLRV